mmetsp:Transcript_80257/g.227235  ORF Transcript_80257/g.227235 Transcript_80257/m.227235 type:complete len:210 (-) Transcript_80257:1435-2064(-)
MFFTDCKYSSISTCPSERAYWTALHPNLSYHLTSARHSTRRFTISKLPAAENAMSAVRLPWALAVMWSGSALAVSAATARNPSSRSAALRRCACAVADLQRAQKSPCGCSAGAGNVTRSNTIFSWPLSIAKSRAEGCPGPGFTSKPARSRVRTRSTRPSAAASSNHLQSGRCTPQWSTAWTKFLPTSNQHSFSVPSGSCATWSHHQRVT